MINHLNLNTLAKYMPIKILNVFEKILENENLTTDFLNLKNLEEIYDFCKKLDSSLTEEEFELGVKYLMKEYKEISKLDESSLEKVTGEKIYQPDLALLLWLQ